MKQKGTYPKIREPRVWDLLKDLALKEPQKNIYTKTAFRNF